MKKLTSKELSCGHIQIKHTKYAKVELYLEHNCYHVRRFSQFIDGRLIIENWICFDTLKEAQRAFSRQCEIMKG